jgi:hypothetical protein
MSKLLNERLCKQLVAEYFHRTKRGHEKQAVVLRELMHIIYAQGHQAGRSAHHQETEHAESQIHPAR